MSNAFINHLNTNVIHTDKGDIEFYGLLTKKEIEELNMDEGLNNFREASKQHAALMKISELEDGNVFIACHNKTIVGYITFHHSEFRRWANSAISELLELGGIEVSSEYRDVGIGKKLIEWTFENYDFEDRIVISLETCYNWKTIKHNSIWEYRNMIKYLMGSVGLKPKITDDPEILDHPANMILARIGKRIDADTKSRFEKLVVKSNIAI